MFEGKIRKNCFVDPLPTESADVQLWHYRTRLENGEVVEEAVAALHSIKEQSRAAHCREHDACTPDGDDGSNGGGNHKT